jgi:hypothetical protein
MLNKLFMRKKTMSVLEQRKEKRSGKMPLSGPF